MGIYVNDPDSSVNNCNLFPQLVTPKRVDFFFFFNWRATAYNKFSLAIYFTRDF